MGEMASPEIMAATLRENASENTRIMFDLLKRLQDQVETLRRDEVTPTQQGSRAESILQTHKSLETLYVNIQSLKFKLATEGNPEDLETIREQAMEVSRQLKNKAPAYIQELLGQLYQGTDQLVRAKQNDAGPLLGTVEQAGKFGGGIVASSAMGGALGMSAASALSSSAYAATTGMILGTAGGIVGAPILVDSVGNAITSNPYGRSVAKTLMYGGLIGGAALLAPAALPGIAVAAGITGAIHGLNWLVKYMQGRGEARPAVQGA